MINAHELKRTTVVLICSAILTVLAVLSAVIFAAAEMSLAAVGVSAALGAASAVIQILSAAKIIRARKFLNNAERQVKDIAFIQYDKSRGLAYLTPNFAEMTGIEVGSEIIGEDDYSHVMTELISGRFDPNEDIYMSCIPEKWLKINSFTVGGHDLIEVFDVSKYVACKNVIKSLKYYDALTNLLSRDAFISQVRTASKFNTETIGIIHFLISGLDKAASFLGTATADNIIARIASFIKKYENPHNIFTGRTSTNELGMLILETYDDGCRRLADKVFGGIKDLVAALPEKEKSVVRVFCGYACFHGNENDAETIMSAADFAAFEAESSVSSVPVEFNTSSYALKSHEFKKIQVFEHVVSGNCIDYHFQPIVNAHTGEIYGYEALMRPRTTDGIKLNPLEVLEIAKQQEMLYRIEQLTFKNTYKILSENQDFFSTRKMFINCIPNALLSDEDFAELADMYGALFDKVVVEVTEENPVFDSAVNIINKRFRSRNTQIALDDYGTGYSNDSTLLAVKPDYIKIDRSIMTNIDKDVQKQHLVANMIGFASEHGIMTLGEGIETEEELETAISLGIDLIQGYYTCKATAVLMLDIPMEIKNKIISFNLKHMRRISRIYRISEPETADVVELALAGFNEIFITSKQAVLKGDPDVEVHMKITCDAEPESRLKLDNVNIASDDSTVLSFAKGSRVNMELEGTNTFSHGGIRVPGGSMLFISGKGNLTVNDTKINSFGIGGGYMQDYGQITLGGEGKIEICCRGDNVIGIGGGIGSFTSPIRIISGSLKMQVDGKDIVGIGSFSGETSIGLNPASVDIAMGGESVVGIGSRNGHITIDSAANLNARISGDNCCCIGTFEKGSGNIIINGGKTNIAVNGKNIVGIGAANGNIETVLNAGAVNVLCEGDNAVGVGDSSGSGSVRCRGTTLKSITKASYENPLGVKNGRVYVRGGSIETSSIEPIECYSAEGERLVQLKTDGRTPFKRTVTSGETTYLYTAEPTGEEFMYVYIPAGFAET